MLIVVSGPDRVGKSTLIQGMSDKLGDNAMVIHHGPPPTDQKNIFDFYRDDVRRWQDSGKKVAIFDRAWPCSYILEQHRRNNAGHFEDLIDLELWINDQIDGAVVHLAQLRPWHWSAPLHVEEIKQEHPEYADWRLRDEYVARMQEHRIYTEQLQNFYEDVTMFPSVELVSTVSPRESLALCEEALRRTGE